MDQDFSITAIMKQKASKFLKILWIVVLCCSFYCLGYYVNENYIKLNIDPEILVKARYVNSRTIPFPAVTICPPNQIKMEILNVSNFFKELKSGKIPKLEDRKIVTGISQVCAKLYKTMEPFINETSDPENIMDIVNTMSRKGEDFFDTCSFYFGNEVDCSMFLIPSLTFLGKCFTFNLVDYYSIFNANISAAFNGYKRKRIIKSLNPETNDEDALNWTNHKGYLTNDDNAHPLRAAGLQSFRISFKTNNSEPSNLCEINSGSQRVFLHLVDEIPTFSNVYTTITYGYSKYMRVNAEIQKLDESLMRYPSDFRKCYFENEKQLRFLKSYTKLNCELECMTNFTYETCGCVAFWMPRTDDMKVCKFENYICYRNISNRWSSSYYQGNDNRIKFPNFPCNCLPTCTRIKYSIINEYSTKRNQISTNFTSSGFQIAFGESQILESTNYVTYKLQNFVSDIGGLVGLFLGFSLLSLFELTLKACAILGGFIKKSSQVKVNKSTSTEQVNSKFGKRRAKKINKSRRKRGQCNSNPDVVVIDLLFGEQIKT